MFNSKVSQALRVMTLVLAVSAMVAVTGCSWSSKKVKQTPAPVVEPSKGGEVTPPNAPSQHPTVGTTEEFPESSGVKDVHFDYDKSAVRADQTAILDKNLQYFKSNPDVKIMIEGHADERGTVEYNFALGQRRAAAIQEYLMKNGIAADRLATVSKGEEQPLDPAHNEAAYKKNRRTHFLRMY
jgi:peptidoglycan-associated lipoprotein